MKVGDIFQYSSLIYSYKYKVTKIIGNTAMIKIIDSGISTILAGSTGQIFVNGAIYNDSKLVERKARHPLTQIFK